MLSGTVTKISEAAFVAATMIAIAASVKLRGCDARPAYADPYVPVAGEFCDGIPSVVGAKNVREMLIENGMIAAIYDINGDGRTDQVRLFNSIDGQTKKGYPVFYQVDEDGDNEPDKVYIDVKGTGRCRDIVLYLDVKASSEKNPDNRPEAEL